MDKNHSLLFIIACLMPASRLLLGVPTLAVECALRERCAALCLLLADFLRVDLTVLCHFYLRKI